MPVRAHPISVFFDPRQLAHQPALELHNGSWADYVEKATRAEIILQQFAAHRPVRDHGMEPILRVHCPDYVAFLRSAHADWLAAGRSGDAIGYTWPVIRRRVVRLDRIDARLGRYSFDAATPITAETWSAAYWSAQAALTAVAAVMEETEPVTFALCRPPGHHSGRDYLGGYCYLNNSAIAAEAAAAAGKRVAILDIDYHHGNGTQDIFYARGDVLFASLHADPATDYPFYWGHADETGEGEGEGANLNIPLPQGTGIDPYRRALEQALDRIAEFKPDLLVCSYGADTFVDDPISHFTLETRDYRLLARDIAGLELPTVVVMEGGYAVEALGSNVAHFLSGF